MNMKDTVEACRESQVSREFSRLQHNVGILREFLSELEIRLTPVTRAGEKDPSCIEQPVPELVPFADSLRNVGFDIENAADRIQRLLKTLEI